MVVGRAIFDRPAHSFFAPLSRNIPRASDVHDVGSESNPRTGSLQTVILITALASLAALIGWMFWAASRILQGRDDAKAAPAREWDVGFGVMDGTRAVRFRDIRSREAERMATVPGEVDYLYEEGYSVGWPEEWAEDLMLRRN